MAEEEVVGGQAETPSVKHSPVAGADANKVTQDDHDVEALQKEVSGLRAHTSEIQFRIANLGTELQDIQSNLTLAEDFVQKALDEGFAGDQLHVLEQETMDAAKQGSLMDSIESQKEDFIESQKEDEKHESEMMLMRSVESQKEDPAQAKAKGSLMQINSEVAKLLEKRWKKKKPHHSLTLKKESKKERRGEKRQGKKENQVPAQEPHEEAPLQEQQHEETLVGPSSESKQQLMSLRGRLSGAVIQLENIEQFLEKRLADLKHQASDS